FITISVLLTPALFPCPTLFRSQEGGRDSFSNKFGVIAAAAGSAIGLGNIWRFPYVAGENGGGAFLMLYLLFILAIGVPVMLSELDRKSTRLNSSHVKISYAVFC